MSYVQWMIRGPKIGSCNCAYGCPCEFNAPPTYGHCEGVECMEIEEGYFGAVRLDGLRVAAAYHWPGPVHEGGGTAQGYIDARADHDQIDALLKILGGEEQDPTTVFNIYASTIDRELDPVAAPITFTCDLSARTGHFSVAGHLECALEPIRNPVTGAAHRAQIHLPEGFEFRRAEMASGRFRGLADWRFDHAQRYGALWYAAYGPNGVIA